MGPDQATEIIQESMGKNMRTSGAEALQDVRPETSRSDGDAVGPKRPSGSSHRGSGARLEANAQTVLPSESGGEAGGGHGPRQEASEICANTRMDTGQSQVVEMKGNNFLRFSLTSIPLRFNVAPVNDITKAAEILGRLGGLAKSAKKTAAVRANGKKGGRPPRKKKTSGSLQNKG